MNRYFSAQQFDVGELIELDAASAKHALVVMRQQVGDQLEVVSSQQRAFIATIQKTDPFNVKITKEITKKVELPVQVTLICGVPKAEKADWIVQKATELGAWRIYFVNTAWAIARWQGPKMAKKRDRLQKIAQAAAEQSHRNLIPEVGILPDLKAVSQIAGEAKLVAYEEAAKLGEASVLVKTLMQKPQSLSVVFGPEGGLAPKEVDLLKTLGYQAAGLGPRILRTETAPLYLLSAVSAYTELQAGTSANQ